VLADARLWTKREPLAPQSHRFHPKLKKRHLGRERTAASKLMLAAEFVCSAKNKMGTRHARSAAGFGCVDTFCGKQCNDFRDSAREMTRYEKAAFPTNLAFPRLTIDGLETGTRWYSIPAPTAFRTPPGFDLQRSENGRMSISICLGLVARPDCAAL
jgi:hypothetical protein